MYTEYKHKNVNIKCKYKWTLGNVHSRGDTVTKADGQLNCRDPSIKNKCSHCQYPVENSLQSNDCKGVQ